MVDSWGALGRLGGSMCRRGGGRSRRARGILTGNSYDLAATVCVLVAGVRSHKFVC